MAEDGWMKPYNLTVYTDCRMQLQFCCNLSYAIGQICSCKCQMQLKTSCIRQLQNGKFLVVIGHGVRKFEFSILKLYAHGYAKGDNHNVDFVYSLLHLMPSKFKLSLIWFSLFFECNYKNVECRLIFDIIWFVGYLT